jgi:ubiquinone/menaquinone biosynthesis C-methylase UbiE
VINKRIISGVLRKLKLLYMFDYAFYFLEKRRNKSRNEDFKKQHPEVKLPPDYLMYESFQLDYFKYFEESKESAKWVADHFIGQDNLDNKTILDWGCGPGRVIRHLPNYFGKNCSFYGTDYNAESISWCKKNLPNIAFNKNELEAILPYQSNFFDFIYGISIFTHLSEQLHFDWAKELLRVLKPGGVLMLTTQGENFKIKLTQEESSIFEKGDLVVRGDVKEGHRTYSAFHPEKFMRELLKNAKILTHEKRPIINGRALPQDVWLISKE